MVQGSEQRAAHRAPMGAMVSWSVDKKEWFEDSSQDVSSTGMMLRTKQQVEQGTKITLKFKLPNLKFQDPIVVDASVARVAQRSGRQTGLGIHFITLRSNNYKVLQEFVSRIIDLPLDGIDSNEGAGYTFQMEKMARESDKRKVRNEEKKHAKAAEKRQKAAVKTWTGRVTKISLSLLGIYLIIKLIGWIMALAEHMPGT